MVGDGHAMSVTAQITEHMFWTSERALERLVELAAKDSAEHLDGKKEVVAWLDPTRAIGRKSTGRHHAMHMWVKFEFLTPGVQHAEEANFCAKMFGIAGNFEQCFCTGSEQEIVDELLILKS